MSDKNRLAFLRDELDRARREFELAKYIDNFERMKREQATAARRIEEIERLIAEAGAEEQP